jgi:hypothetical protein
VGSNPTPSANSLFVAVRHRSETFKIALKIGTFYLDTSVAIRHNPSQCHGLAATPDSSALRASTPRPRSRQIGHFLYRHRFASSPRHPLQLRRAPCAPCSRLASSADTSTSPSTTVPNPRATISSPMKTSGGDERGLAAPSFWCATGSSLGIRQPSRRQHGSGRQLGSRSSRHDPRRC